MSEESAQIKRLICQYQGEERGPLLIVLAAIHGNEVAGVKALQLVQKMLDVEPITNPTFSFKGRILGLLGNVSAYNAQTRYIHKDLNRLWHQDILTQVLGPFTLSIAEYVELRELHEYISQQIKTQGNEPVYVLDLHTTSSSGGIFTIPGPDPKSLDLAEGLFAPIILGLQERIAGTTLGYFNSISWPGYQVTSVTFEAGSHDDPLSVNRCIAAIINCMRAIGNVESKDVESVHDDMLKRYSTLLPKVSRLRYTHSITVEDRFVMRPGYQNFDVVKKDEVLGSDRHGDILSPADGRILMPLYQPQGSEGFYIIQDDDSASHADTSGHL